MVTEDVEPIVDGDDDQALGGEIFGRVFGRVAVREHLALEEDQHGVRLELDRHLSVTSGHNQVRSPPRNHHSHFSASHNCCEGIMQWIFSVNQLR